MRRALLGVVMMVGVLAACTTAPSHSGGPTLSLDPSGYAPGVANATKVASWHGIGTKTVAFVPQDGHQLGVRIVCASGDYTVRSASGERMFWGPCGTSGDASGAAPARRWGDGITVQVGSGVAWKADVWALN